MTDLWAPGDIQANIKTKRGKPVTRDTVTRWQRRADFPKVQFEHGTVRFYDRADVLAWHAAYKLKDPRKREMLKLLRKDASKPVTFYADAVECAWGTADRWIEELGFRT
jgi:hypothetical protein